MPDEDELRAWKHDLVDAAAELGIRIDPDKAAVSVRNMRAEAEEYDESMRQQLRRRLRTLVAIDP